MVKVIIMAMVMVIVMIVTHMGHFYCYICMISTSIQKTMPRKVRRKICSMIPLLDFQHISMDIICKPKVNKAEHERERERESERDLCMFVPKVSLVSVVFIFQFQGTREETDMFCQTLKQLMAVSGNSVKSVSPFHMEGHGRSQRKVPTQC